MPPPLLPFFRGQRVSAAEDRHLLVIRPKAGLEFTEPPGTSALYLPFARIIAVRALPYTDDPAWSAVRFTGEFKRVERTSPVQLGALPGDDAGALVRALTERYSLPRLPRALRTSELRTARNEYVVAVGTYAPGHFETPDFEGVQLDCGPAVQQTLIPGRRYYVEGFVDPGAAPGSLVVGYAGPTLRVLRIEPE